MLRAALAFALSLFLTLGALAGDGSVVNPFVVTGDTNFNTYSASAAFSNSGTGDLFCIYGSATKLVEVKGIRVTGVNGGSTTNASMAIIRRSTLGSGGGLTAITPVPSDTSNPPVTATAMFFTTTPTPGTTVGNVRNRYITLPATAAASVSEGLFQFTPYWDQPQILRGTSQGLCVNAASAGASWAIDAEWTEM
jgi:hypothetical protein